jgi:hypothetical protein
MRTTACRSIGRMFLVAISFVIGSSTLVSIVSGQAQATNVISGKIVNASGQPLAGISVGAWDTTTGYRHFTTTSLADGTYTINISTSDCGLGSPCPNEYGQWNLDANVNPNGIPITKSVIVNFYSSNQVVTVNCTPSACIEGPLPPPPSCSPDGYSSRNIVPNCCSGHSYNRTTGGRYCVTTYYCGIGNTTDTCMGN